MNLFIFKVLVLSAILAHPLIAEPTKSIGICEKYKKDDAISRHFWTCVAKPKNSNQTDAYVGTGASPQFAFCVAITDCQSVHEKCWISCEINDLAKLLE